jgi:cathepsin E
LSGFEYTDTVSLSSTLTATNQSIGVALESEGFSGYDGILGIGPVALTDGTVVLGSTVPTITDTLFAEKKISSYVVLASPSMT